jgi:very-short-patch-repair endonuclease/predicted transcriptional regulator of viral defense system
MHHMRASGAQTTTDHLIAALAARQYGVVARAQLAAAGLERGAIARRLATGRLHRLHDGVYAVGHLAPRREARWLAAVLACGPGAVLSHRSAAALWGIHDAEGPSPDVTIATRNGRRRAAITVHRAQLARPDRRRRAGIPVTSPARTLADLARQLDHPDLVRAVREAQFLRRFDLAAAQELLDRRPCRALRTIVEDLALTQSGLEDRLLDICDGHGISRPLTQQPLRGRRMDFLWPYERVVVETDGWQGHGTRSAFQADRTISNRLQLDGYTILRFTHSDVARRPAHVARQIRQALATAGAVS